MDKEEVCSLRDSLSVKRDLMKRRKDVAIWQNLLIYSKEIKTSDLCKEKFNDFVIQSKKNYQETKSAFLIPSDNKIRVIMLDKCTCKMEQVKDRWKIRFSQNNKSLEIFYETKEKCQKWFDAVEEAKNPKPKKTPSDDDSFTGIPGIDEEEKIGRFTLMEEVSHSTISKKPVKADFGTQHFQDTQDASMETVPKLTAEVDTATEVKEFREAMVVTDDKETKDISTATQQKTTREVDIGTEQKKYLDSATCTERKEYKSSGF